MEMLIFLILSLVFLQVDLSIDHEESSGSFNNSRNLPVSRGQQAQKTTPENSTTFTRLYFPP